MLAALTQRTVAKPTNANRRGRLCGLPLTDWFNTIPEIKISIHIKHREIISSLHYCILTALRRNYDQPETKPRIPS